jgi:hypothetical protein
LKPKPATYGAPGSPCTTGGLELDKGKIRQ